MKDDKCRTLMIQRHWLCCDSLTLSALVLGWVLKMAGRTMRQCSLLVSVFPFSQNSFIGLYPCSGPMASCMELCIQTRNTCFSVIWFIILYYKWHFHVSASQETVQFSERFLERMDVMFFFPPVISELGMVFGTLQALGKNPKWSLVIKCIP